MWRQLFCLVGFAAILCAPSTGLAGLTPVLGSAQDYAVLGASTVTNTGPTTITGDVGLYPGPSITGFQAPPANTLVQGPTSTGLISNAPGLVTGTIHIADTVGPANAMQAQVDLTKAFTALAALPATRPTPPADVGGQTLLPGVYHFDSTAAITGTLKLDAQSTNGVYWVFQIPDSLTTASTNSVVQFIDPGSNNGSDVGVFWVVGSSATLNASTSFQGNILAYASISILDGVTLLNGRALAEVGQVSMINDTISNVCLLNNNGPGFSGGLGFDVSGTLVPIPTNPTAVPLPGALLLFVSGMGSVFTFGRRFFSVS
jgi:hypothetical protein